MDLNEFKKVNDTYGHSMGDALLVEIANRISSCCLEDDILYRIGGDEFVAITHDIKQVEIYRDVVNKPFIINGIELKSSLSIGYSRFPDDGTTLDALIRIADTKMYENKELSR
ncbi:MAG: GGDEF domain-containing protein [Erysipelotrichales bacterium]|nr:GGDEF domain-containing protein [Erysipelotrichales bacterium]